MPATAGRVRMPANNRVHSSAALQTHGIWQSAIGYDPYAPSESEKKAPVQAGSEAGNAYDSFQGLLALARLTSSNASEARGACKKCGRIGHLTFQCRNFLSIKDGQVLLPEPENECKEKDKSRMDNSGGEDKIPAGKKEGNSSDEEDNYRTDLTDSSEDSEMERIIAKRFGSKFGKRSSKISVKKLKVSSEDDCGKNERAEGGERRSRRRRRGKGGKGRVSYKKRDKFRVSYNEMEEYEDSESEGSRSRRRKSWAPSKNSEKSRFSSDDECEDSDNEARRRRKKREISVSSKKHDRFSGTTHEESDNSDSDDERDATSQSRGEKSRVSKKYRVSRVPSNTEDREYGDRESRKRVKFRRSSKRVYSGRYSSDLDGERNRRRKRREYPDEYSYCSTDEERKRKRSKCRSVEYSDYSEDERRKGNGSCSTGSNSDSEEETRRNHLRKK